MSNLILAYTSPDLLIVDDLGLRGLAKDEPADLYEIVRRRYERGSTVITSNRDISEWATLRTGWRRSRPT